MNKAKKKVLEWGSFLCGIINEYEQQPKKGINSADDSLSDERGKLSQESDKSPL